MTPDVNVLVAAFRADHAQHVPASTWLAEARLACRQGHSLHVLPMVASGFLRVVTNPRIFPVPASVEMAAVFIDTLLRTPGVSMPALGPEWRAFQKLCTDLDLRGNDIPDAWIAAAVAAGGLHLVTFDRGFRRMLRPTDYTVLGAQIQEPVARYEARKAGGPGRTASATRSAKAARSVANRAATSPG